MKISQIINPRIFYYLRQFKSKVLVLCAGLFVFEIFKLIPPFIFAFIIDQLVKFSDQTFVLVVQLIALFFLASVIAHVLEMVFDRYWIKLFTSIHSHLLGSASSRLLSLSLGYHEDRSTGASMHRVHRGVDKFTESLFQIYTQLIPTLFQVIVTFSILLILHWPSALIFITIVPIFLAYTLYISIKLQPLRTRYHALGDRAAGQFTQSVINIRTVQDYAREEDEIREHRHWLELFSAGMIERSKFESGHSLVRDIMLALARVLSMLFYVYMVILGQISPGILVFFVTLTEKSYLSLFRIGRILNWAGDSMEAINLLVTILDEEEKITEPKNAKPFQNIAGDLVFQNVNFHYTSSPKPVLQDVSFAVPPRKTLAVVGRSGSGKSTIVKLLFRHFDINEGTIAIDGTDIRDVTKKSLRDNLAIVAQDVEIFNGTVLENIRYSLPNATQAEVEEAGKIAHAHDFILGFPEGYNTLVGERGVKLSGGQKQRIGIARAILKKPAILVFDEATSSLDSESEKLIQSAMWQISKTCTMIIIAHRLSTIQHADQIIVLDDGKIVESGTHAELMQKKGHFARMQTLQHLGEIRE